MSWEWVSPACVALVGAFGIRATRKTAKEGRDHVEKLDRDRFRHEQAMARAARRADAYVRLLGMVERVGQWVQMVKPLMDAIPPQPVRPLPDLDEQGEVEAAIRAFGSEPVRDALESWRKIVRDVITQAGLIDLEAADRASGQRVSRDDYGRPYEKLHELRPTEVVARDELARLVNVELAPTAADTP